MAKDDKMFLSEICSKLPPFVTNYLLNALERAAVPVTPTPKEVLEGAKRATEWTKTWLSEHPAVPAEEAREVSLLLDEVPMAAVLELFPGRTLETFDEAE